MPLKKRIGTMNDNIESTTYNKTYYNIIYRDTASETVRTLLVYGYNLDPPTGEANEGTSITFILCYVYLPLFIYFVLFYIFRIATPLTDDSTNRYLTFRTYRAEKTYAVSSGKW
jgi:ryanodine receptor 2